MRNPLLWLICALVLSGLAFLAWSLGPGSVDNELFIPIAQDAQPGTADRTPADLSTPTETEVATENASETAEVEAVEPEVLPTDPKREAVPVGVPVKITGRVVDVATGEGVPDVWVSLVCGKWVAVWKGDEIEPARDDSERPGGLTQTMSASDGTFEFDEVGGKTGQGCSVFVANTLGWIIREDSRDLTPAQLEHGVDLVFEARQWPPPSAGDISGVLKAETGSFPANAVPRSDHILLDLTSTGLPAIEMRAALTAHKDDAGGVTLNFLFKDVPEGEYNLTLSSLGNYRWAPTSMLIAPPATGLEFLRFDLDEVLPLRFEVVDAKSGEPVEDFEARHIKQTNSQEHGVLLHTGPLEGEQFPRDQAFVWSVEAPGYAVAYGDERDFEEREGKRVARVELQPGWSTRFLVMGGPKGTRPQPLSGADVRIEGHSVGLTGTNGGLVVLLEEAPEAVEVRYLDWQLVNPIELVKHRSNVTPVILSEPDRN